MDGCRQVIAFMLEGCARRHGRRWMSTGLCRGLAARRTSTGRPFLRRRRRFACPWRRRGSSLRELGQADQAIAAVSSLTYSSLFPTWLVVVAGVCVRSQTWTAYLDLQVVVFVQMSGRVSIERDAVEGSCILDAFFDLAYEVIVGAKDLSAAMDGENLPVK
jgi:hypothetical protein